MYKLIDKFCIVITSRGLFIKRSTEILKNDTLLQLLFEPNNISAAHTKYALIDVLIQLIQFQDDIWDDKQSIRLIEAQQTDQYKKEKRIKKLKDNIEKLKDRAVMIINKLMKKMTSSGKKQDKAKDSIVSLKQQKFGEQLELTTQKAYLAVEFEQSAEQNFQEARLKEQELNTQVHIAYQRQQAAYFRTKLSNNFSSHFQADFVIYTQKNQYNSKEWQVQSMIKLNKHISQILNLFTQFSNCFSKYIKEKQIDLIFKQSIQQINNNQINRNIVLIRYINQILRFTSEIR